MQVVVAGRREHVDVLHRLGAGRLDVVLDAGRNEHDRARSDLTGLVADVVDGRPLCDERDLVEVVTVRADVHAGLAMVEHQHGVAGAERAAAHARPDGLVGDLVPGVGGHQEALLSWSEKKPSSAERISAVSRRRRQSGALSRAGRLAIVPTTAIVATHSRSWKIGVAIARIPSSFCVLIAIPVWRTRS